MDKGTITCIVGRNGSGKTMYVERLRRLWASDSVRYVAFGDAYGASTDKSYYLQLRWNQHDIDAETPTTGQLLERSYLLTGADSADRRQLLNRLLQLFGLEELLDKPIIMLSSGELRKYQLAKTLLAAPRTVILDNPYIGLDAETRQLLTALLKQLAWDWGIDVVLVLAKSDDLPVFADRVVSIDDKDGEPKEWMPGDYLTARQTVPPHVLDKQRRQRILALQANDGDYHAREVIAMRNVSIRYGERTILNKLNWTVNNGECWSLSGQNGSGKSTLLSLVCADNPQSYACDMTLFGFQRGTGESIWDIKRHIGYVSPEMHRSYRRALPALHVVASGLKDTVGLYVKAGEQERERCRWWMDIFGVGHLADRLFTSLSSGEQRLVLLARAFVKDPELLILDEPFHGLDNWNRQLVRDIIETFAQRRNKTMIIVTHYEEELPQCITHRLRLEKTAEGAVRSD